MKNNGTTTILNWALIAGAILLTIAGIKYYNKTKTVRTYQVLIAEFSQLQSAQSLIGGLVNESVEFSKTHPDINPTLELIGFNKQQPAKPAPAAPKPVSK